MYCYGHRRAAIITNALLTVMFFGKFSTFTGSIAFLTIFIVLQIIFTGKLRALETVCYGLAASVILYLIYNPHLTALADYISGVLKISSGWMKTQQVESAFSLTDWRAFLSF